MSNLRHRSSRAWACCVALVFLSPCLAPAPRADNIEATIQWQVDVEQAQQLGARHNRLVLLHFWSKDCPTCENLEQGTFRDPAFVTALHTSYIPVKINVDQFPQLRRRYRIRRWPTDVVLTAGGDEVHRGLSRPTTGQYQSLLSAIATRHRGTRQQLSPVLQNPLTRVAQVNHDQKDKPKPARTSQGNLAPPTVTYGVSFDPTAQPVANQRQPARVATARPLPPGTGQRQPSGTPPTDWSARNSEYTPRWIEAPQLQPPAQPAGRETATTPGEHPGQAAILQARLQNTVNPAFTQPAPAPVPVPRYNFTNTRLGLGGYCPVTLLGTPEQVGNWVIGDRRWGIMHRDRLYLFAAAAQRDLFLEDPDRYSPVISGYDPVVLAEHQQLVDGHREYGVTYKGRIYLFASEATLKKFWLAPAHYMAMVDEAMQATRQGPASPLPANPSTRE